MRFLAKKIQGVEMDMEGFISMLLGQKPFIMGAVLTILGSALGFGADVHLKIGDCTDRSGGEEGNMIPSQQRTENVMNAIVAKGIFSGRFAAEGCGEQYPACPVTDASEGIAENGRIINLLSA